MLKKCKYRHDNNIKYDNTYIQVVLLYLPTQIRFPIGGKRVTCRGSKLTNFLGRTKFTNSLGNNNLNFWLARDQVVLLETVANFWASRHKANNFFAVFRYFWVGRYNKTLNDLPLGKQRVLFPLNLDGGCQGNKTHCFPWGQSLSVYWLWLKKWLVI